MSFFLCSCLKTIEDTSLSLSLIIEGESQDTIKTIISSRGIIVLSITATSQIPQESYTIQGNFPFTLYLRTEEEVLLAAWAFCIPYTTILDQKKLIATDLIIRIHKEQKEKRDEALMKDEEKKLREEETKKKFTDSRLASIKEIMNYLSNESSALIEWSQNYNDIKKTKSFADALDEVKKIRMGTNIDKMINACDTVYAHIEYFLQAKHTNPHQKKPIQWSELTYQDIIDTLIAYHKSQYAKLSFTPHSWDDRLFLALEKLGIFRKLFWQEKKKTSWSNNFIGYSILTSLDMLWIIMWIWIGLISLRLHSTNTVNPIMYLIFLYYGLGSISRWLSRRLVRITDMQTIIIWAWFFGAISLWWWYLITKTFGL